MKVSDWDNDAGSLPAQVIQRAKKLWKGASDKAELLARVEFVEGSFFESSAPQAACASSREHPGLFMG